MEIFRAKLLIDTEVECSLLELSIIKYLVLEGTAFLEVLMATFITNLQAALSNSMKRKKVIKFRLGSLTIGSPCSTSRKDQQFRKSVWARIIR